MLAVLVDHLDARQIVTLAGFEIVGVVRGRDLHGAGAELRVGQIVENDRESGDSSAADRTVRPCRSK